MKVRRQLGWLWVGLLVACGEDLACPPWADSDGAPTGPLRDWLATLPAEAPGVDTPLLRDPATSAVTDAASERLWVDPSPHLRGDHVMWSIARGPRCEVIATPTFAGPGLAGPRAEVFGPTVADPRLGALVLSSEAPTGPAQGWDAWERALGELGVAGLSLSGFSGLEGENSAEAALAARLAATAPGGVFVLVVSGPASPAGPGLVFARAGGTPLVLSFARLSATLTRLATHLGLLIWVVDASYAAELRPPVGVPTVLVRASDAFATESPRASRGGPSALGLAFEAALSEAREARCVDQATDPGEVAALLVEAARHTRAHLTRLRWEQIGQPALARLEASGELSAPLRAGIEDWLERQAPREIVTDNLRGAALPAEAVCEADPDCTPRDACLSACAKHRCEEGRCVSAPSPGTPCDDGDACTEGDRCDEGGACLGEAVQCGDAGPCTELSCDPARGCVAVPATDRACDDGDPCTLSDRCEEGRCVGDGDACDDGDPCTTDTCEPGFGCRHTPRDGLACDDGDPCTLADRCQAGLCLGVPRPCGDNNPCTADRCDRETGACVFLPLADLVSCVDEDPCTSASRCVAGRCEGLARTCDDGIACTLDRCAPDGTCQHLPEPGTCLSPIPGEGCVPVGASPAGDPCATCVATGVWAYQADGASCGPGDGCAAARCLGGRCVVGPDADSCATPEGGCVAAGEAVTECLSCVGGGVATPREGACAGPPECGIGACIDGTCVTAGPLPCCPPRVMACGETWTVDRRDFAGLVSRVDVWTGGAAPGRERWLEVVPPCDGVMDLAVAPLGEPEGDALLVLEATPCVPGLISAGAGVSPPYPSGPLATSFYGVEVTAGEAVPLAVEVVGDGAWRVTSVCRCLE